MKISFKQKNRRRMNNEWIGKSIKRIDPKYWKNRKNRSESAACEQKTPFSQSILKIERLNFTRQNHSLFHSISCSDVTKITTPIWLQKSWKCVTDLEKKDIAQRIPETTRRRKLPILPKLEQVLWTLSVHKWHKSLRKNRNGIQKQIEQKTRKI